MQKKLADYLQALMEHKDEALAEYYEPHALMMSDEVSLAWYKCHRHHISLKRIVFQGHGHFWNSSWIECDWL